MCQIRPVRRDSRGFSLIEVLIGVLVVAIGMLIVAGLQITSKRSGFDAIQRTTASMLAHDLAARMRANRGALAGYLAPTGSPLTGTSPTPSRLCTPGQTCTPNQLATFDLWEFDQVLGGAQESRVEGGAPLATGGLTSVSACVTGPVFGGAGLYTIAIAWRGTSPLENPTANTCGQGSGNYGANDEYRRLMVLPVFISN